MRKGYKMTEVGEIPVEWECSSTEKILKKEKGSLKIGPFGSQLKKEYLVSSGYKVYGQENVFNNNFTLGDRYINEEKFKQLESCELCSGDLVISMMGTVGKTAIIPKDIEKGIMDSHLIRLRVDKSIYNIELLAQFIRNSEIIKNQIKRLSVGGIMEGLSSNIIKQLKFPIPLLKEQEKIAAILSIVDEQIENTKSLIEKTKELKKGLMQRLLTKGIGHEEFKETEVGVIPKEWEVKKLEEICEILDLKRVPLNEKQRLDMQGDIPYYGANAIVDYINKYLFDDELILMAEDGGNFLEYEERPIAFYVTGKCWVNNHAHVLKAINLKSSKWIFYSLVHKDITDIVQGGTRAKLNQKDLRRISIPFPNNISEQTKIADILSSVDEKIEEYEDEKEKLQQLKQGLIQKLFTGKIRVI